jgi:hypothetical protein
MQRWKHPITETICVLFGTLDTGHDCQCRSEFTQVLHMRVMAKTSWLAPQLTRHKNGWGRRCWNIVLEGPDNLLAELQLAGMARSVLGSLWTFTQHYTLYLSQNIYSTDSTFTSSVTADIFEMDRKCLVVHVQCVDPPYQSISSARAIWQ